MFIQPYFKVVLVKMFVQSSKIVKTKQSTINGWKSLNLFHPRLQSQCNVYYILNLIILFCIVCTTPHFLLFKIIFRLKGFQNKIKNSVKHSV